MNTQSWIVEHSWMFGLMNVGIALAVIVAFIVAGYVA